MNFWEISFILYDQFQFKQNNFIINIKESIMKLTMKDAMLNQLQQNEQLKLVNFRLLQALKDTLKYWDELVNLETQISISISKASQQARGHFYKQQQNQNQINVQRILEIVVQLEKTAKQKNDYKHQLIAKVSQIKAAERLKNLDNFIAKQNFHSLSRQQRNSIIQEQQLSILAQQYKQIKIQLQTVCKNNEDIHLINEQLKKQNKHLRIIVDNLRETLIENTSYCQYKHNDDSSPNPLIQKASFANFSRENIRVCSSFELPSVREFDAYSNNLYSKPQLKQSTPKKQSIFFESNKIPFTSSRIRHIFSKSPSVLYQEKQSGFQSPKNYEKSSKSINRESSRSTTSNRKFLKQLQYQRQKDSVFLRQIQQQNKNQCIIHTVADQFDVLNRKSKEQVQNIRPSQKSPSMLSKIPTQDMLKYTTNMNKPKFRLRDFQNKIMHQGYGSVSAYFR